MATAHVLLAALLLQNPVQDEKTYSPEQIEILRKRTPDTIKIVKSEMPVPAELRGKPFRLKIKNVAEKIEREVSKEDGTPIQTLEDSFPIDRYFNRSFTPVQFGDKTYYLDEDLEYPDFKRSERMWGCTLHRLSLIFTILAALSFIGFLTMMEEGSRIRGSGAKPGPLYYLAFIIIIGIGIGSAVVAWTTMV